MTDGRNRTARAPAGIVSADELIAFIKAILATSGKSGHVLALLMLDLRRSDRLRALAGDAKSVVQLNRIVNRLAGTLRPHDRLAVVSPDEIWAALPELPHQQIAVIAATRILNVLQHQAEPPASGYSLRPCIGVACYPDHADSLDGMLVAADSARRAAMEREENYAVHQPSQPGSDRDPRFAAELREALKLNAMELHYQPQVNLRNNECQSAEALIRWSRPDGGQVSPTLIAEAAERGEMQHPFMLFVLNTALRHMSDLGRDGCRIRTSVNVSPLLVSNEELPSIIEQTIETWSVPPAQLTIEVTERAIVADVERSAEILRSLKKIGVRLAMDDFGTGYSSLAHLKLFPFDEIKIDQLFVKNMLHSRGDLQIVRAMIDLGHNFDMEVVAEGVEDLPTLERLKELNCDVAQGYAVARPMSMQAFGEWWRSRGSLSTGTRDR